MGKPDVGFKGFGEQKVDTYESRWNMMGAELTRMAEIADKLDILHVMVREHHNSALRPYISLQWAFYMRFTGTDTDKWKKRELKAVETTLSKAQELLNNWLRLPDNFSQKKLFQQNIADTLFKTHTMLMSYKQSVGLGIQFKFRLSDIKRMKKDAGLV